MKAKRLIGSILSTLFAVALFGTAQAQSTLKSVAVGPQSPVSASSGGLAYFPIRVTRAGVGSLSVYLSVSGLPEGATFAFVPPEVVFTDKDPSAKNATLVVRLATSTLGGVYPITLTARHGHSPNTVTSTSTLVISGNVVILQPPVLFPPVLQPDGTVGLSGSGNAAQPVLVQATTNLVSGTFWETIAVQSLDERGLFAFVDQDSTNYPARFYRLAQ